MGGGGVPSGQLDVCWTFAGTLLEVCWIV